MASRKEEKERLRQERLEAEQAAAESAGQRRVLGLAIGGGLIAAAVAAVVVVVVAGGGDGGGDGGGGDRGGVQVDDRTGTKPPAVQVADLRKSARLAGCTVGTFPDEGRMHVKPAKEVRYKTKPPTSGNHDPVPTEDGAYLTTPEDRHFVHSLEHGRILIQYSPSLSKERQLRLKGLFDEDPGHMLLFPNKDMPFEVAATAWRHRLGCPKYNDRVFDAVRAFKDSYRDRGPEFIP